MQPIAGNPVAHAKERHTLSRPFTPPFRADATAVEFGRNLGTAKALRPEFNDDGGNLVAVLGTFGADNFAAADAASAFTLFAGGSHSVGPRWWMRLQPFVQLVAEVGNKFPMLLLGKPALHRHRICFGQQHCDSHAYCPIEFLLRYLAFRDGCRELGKGIAQAVVQIGNEPLLFEGRHPDQCAHGGRGKQSAG